MGFIYKIFNSCNDKIYIGQTRKTIEFRWKQHIQASKTGNQILYKAIRKYGLENFHIQQIEECVDEMLNDREIFWIEYYNSYYNGYNMTLGGHGIHTLDYDSIIEVYNECNSISKTASILGVGISSVREVIRREQIQYDKDRSLPKIIEMIDSKTLQTIRVFESIMEAASYNDNWKRETIKDAVSGRRQSAYGFFWQEQKNEKIFSNQTLHKHKRKIIQYDKNNNFIALYESVAEANRALGKPSSNRAISNALNGRSNTAYSYIWKYAD